VSNRAEVKRVRRLVPYIDRFRQNPPG